MSIDKEKLIILSKTKSIEEISKIVDIPYSTVWYNLRKYGISILRKPKHRYPLFDTYTPESCYWAGFIAADGNVLVGKKEYRTTIKLQKSDIDHLLKFKNIIGSQNKIFCRGGLTYICIFSKQMFYSLQNNFNIIPNKSLVLNPPIMVPDNLISHYIRGYFDGDGHIGYGGGTYCNFNIVSGSKNIIFWLSNIFKSFGLISNDHIYKKHCFCFDVNSIKSLDILNWLYVDSNTDIRLDRKYYKYMIYKKAIETKLNEYSEKNQRRPPGCIGFDLDYQPIAKEYLDGNTLKQLADKYNVSQWTLLDNFKKLGVRKTTKRFLNEMVFNIFTPESCYWAGFLAADGYINKYRVGCELAIVDKPHLIKLRDFLESNANITTRTRTTFNKVHKYCSICFNSKLFAKILEKRFNITKNKSLTFVPPDLPSNMAKHFIRGYVDGDGSIGWHKYNKTLRLNICSGSKNMIEWAFNYVKNDVESVGDPTIQKRKDSNLYMIEFVGKQTTNILSWLYRDSSIYLDRKYNKFLDYSQKEDIYLKNRKKLKNNDLLLINGENGKKKTRFY